MKGGRGRRDAPKEKGMEPSDILHDLSYEVGSRYCASTEHASLLVVLGE
jgi:hypothetical protein